MVKDVLYIRSHISKYILKTVVIGPKLYEEDGNWFKFYIILIQ